MAFPFSEVSTLLSRLEDIELHDPPIIDAGTKAGRARDVVSSWFKSHRSTINALSTEHAVAFLSTLLPERGTDRVYGIQAPRLCRILGRALKMTSARLKDLQAFRENGRGDLGVCVERTIRAGGPPAQPPVTMVEVDEMLQELASQCRFSAPNVFKAPPSSSADTDQLFERVFNRLSPCESKWMVRLILKDFSPVCLNERLVLKSFHFLLPDLLLFQNSFVAAIHQLKTTMAGYPEYCDPRSERLYRLAAREKIRPVVGVKISKPQWSKVRSIDQCMKITNGRRWVIERKYDGEYCEIHVDVTRSANPLECITIFSKSGKDSTADRAGLHQTLVDCLVLGKPDCKIKSKAILLGEMVVFSNTERRVMPFDKIRKYVSRSGSFLGTDFDSLPSDDEHLGIVFFDLLLLDDELVLNKTVNERREWLRGVYTKIAGRAMSAEWKIVDFSNKVKAKKMLVQQFAASIAERCEGLILKPCDVPYFDLDSGPGGSSKSFLKLKKDYIAGEGDEADLAVVGARYNAQQALRSGLHSVQYTDFYVACLRNKAEVLRFDARPRFKVVGVIQQDHCIPRPVLQAANELARFRVHPIDTTNIPHDLEHLPSGLRPSVLFDRPFVFEVLGSGFDKPSNCNFFMLRHARVKKVHQDRGWRDCVSFQELQQMAKASRAEPVDSESQETRRWVQRLERKCKVKFERGRAGTKTPSTVRTSTTRAGSQGSGATAARAATDELDGTTLMNTSPKRKRVEDMPATPCPGAKRARHRKTPSSDQGRKQAGPLADITNTVKSSPRVSSPDKTASSKNTSPEKTSPARHRTPALVPQQPKLRSSQKRKSLHLCTAETSQTVTPHPDCDPQRCPLACTAVYLAPCIASTPYVHDLLAIHRNVTVITDLDFWSRDCAIRLPVTIDGHGFPREIVRESPAYEGHRRIVLVESRRRKQVDQILGSVSALRKQERLGLARIEVRCWRDLEAWASQDPAQSAGEPLVVI